MTFAANAAPGAPVPDWRPPPFPPRATIDGRYVRLEPLDPARHADDLFDAFAEDAEGRNWTYRLQEPFPTRTALRAWLDAISVRRDPQYYAYVDKQSGRALGNGALMSVAPQAGSIEVGSIMFAPRLQGTRAATEAMALKMARVFELGYRRYEWTCDPLNDASVRAALRLGFRHEATFRQAYVTKGRNRDKAVFSILDSEWPALRSAFETWLAAENFDAGGRQRARLSALTADALGSDGGNAS